MNAAPVPAHAATYTRSGFSAFSFPMIAEKSLAPGGTIAEGTTGTTHEALFKKGDKDAYFALRKKVGLDGFEAGWTSLRFIALEALAKAVEQAGSLDRAKVMAALRTLRYETLHGELAFSFGVEVAGKKVDGVGNKKVFPAQWQNGKIEVVWPAELATAKYRPRP